MTLIETLLYRVEELERRLNNVVRDGRVTDVDAQKGVRVAIAEGDDGPVKTPWIKGQENAGGLTTWAPMQEGQWVKIFSPNGEIGASSMAAPHHYSDGHDQPSQDLNEPMLKCGSTEIRMSDGKLIINAKELVFNGDKATFNADQTAVKGSSLKHNAREIGDTHRHRGVQTGTGLSDAPN